MVMAGRAYYDSLAKIGDISADSPVSKELGKWNIIFQNYFKIYPLFIFLLEVHKTNVEKDWKKGFTLK